MRNQDTYRESDNNLGKAAETMALLIVLVTTATVVLTFVPVPGLATKDISVNTCQLQQLMMLLEPLMISLLVNRQYLLL